MASKKRSSSTANNPFGKYREFTPSISINEAIIDGLDLQSRPLNALEVNWPALLAGSELNYPGIIDALCDHLDATRPSAIAALVSITASHARVMRDMDATPFPTEIAKQLRDLRAALRRVGALAQGKKADEQFTLPPEWPTEASSQFRDGQEDMPPPLQARSRVLHPILQDHVESTMEVGRNKIADDFERRLSDKHLAKQQKRMLTFFDTLPEILDFLEKTVADAEQLGMPLKRERKKGAPANRAGDWAMIRLLWIWRDVLGREISIYVRRISGRVEQDAPEPNACVSFVQRVMERIDPQMLPVGTQNLERKLIALRPQVPAAPLIFDPSRNN